MSKLRYSLKPTSHIKYLFWKLWGCQYDLVVKINTDQKIVIRKFPKQDISTANEIFTQHIYHPPIEIVKEDVKRIIDVGSNVGYSCLYWLNFFPNAHILAFEPHPEHVQQITRHLEINRLAERVMIIPKAAGICSGEYFLTDMGASSTIVESKTQNTISVSMTDWFSEIGTEIIDLLKIDIEGGEYYLLDDPRFEDLDIKLLVLEWHNIDTYPSGEKWCIERLEKLNYKVIPTANFYSYGVLWAFSK